MPPGANQDSPVCVCFTAWMNMCLCASFSEFLLMIVYHMCVCMNVCVSAWCDIQLMCVCVCACRLGSGWLCSSSHTTANW